VQVVALAPERFGEFVDLVNALALYEKLSPPSSEAIARLREHAFGVQPKYQAYLAVTEDGASVGYAICLETYSSFLAKPTMYLEDLFVLEEHRTSGAGGLLFEAVKKQAADRGCGRLDWQVLDWNMLARDFYARRNATWMNEWLLYRLTL